jgi:hypothetical protein
MLIPLDYLLFFSEFAYYLRDGNSALTIVTQQILDFIMTQFRTQVSQCRFSSMIAIYARRLQAVAACTALDIYKRQIQTVLAMKPCVCPVKSCQIFFVTEQVERREHGIGRTGGCCRSRAPLASRRSEARVSFEWLRPMTTAQTPPGQRHRQSP